jgi:hypothetical protein
MSGSKKKGTDWTEHLGDSALPKDEMTFTMGSNFGLDGFQFSESYNEGVEDAARLPETHGMSGLPDGIIQASEAPLDMTILTADEDGPVLADMLSEEEGALGKDAALLDLLWLDPTQEQDLTRLPDGQATLDSVSQLEEAWGEDRQTDGLHLVPAVDREKATYEAALGETPAPTVTAEDANKAIVRSLRRAHFGHPLQKIKADLAIALSGREELYQKAAASLDAEYGLLGNVYVMASVFPGLRNGKYAPELKRAARTARYVITDDEAVAVKLSKQMVTEVPWKQALQTYQPLLEAAGHKVAGGSPRDVLRAAFMSGPRIQAPEPAVKPVVKPVVASDDEARTAIAIPQPEAVFQTTQQKAAANKRKRAMLQIAKWVKAGRLAQEDALRLHDSPAIPEVLLHTASKLMTATGDVANYDGIGAHLPEGAQEARRGVWASLEEQEAQVEASLQETVKKDLLQAVKNGSLTTEEAQRIVAMGRTASETREVIAAAILAAQGQRKANLQPTVTKDYEGTVQSAAPVTASDVPQASEETLRIQRVAKESGYKSTEIVKVLRWARQRMTEGDAGDILMQIAGAKFTGGLLEAAAPLLKELRATHEGLSGHLYVDATAYAVGAGAKGCKAAASRHRANGIKHVMAMTRCAECVYANADKVCTQFNKKLTSVVPTEDPKAFQAEMIRLANGSDAVSTAALFSTKEYDLNNDALDDIQVEESPAPEVLEDVLFGDGLQLED